MSQGVGTYRQSSQLTRALPPALGAMLGAGVLVGPAPASAAAGVWLPVSLILAAITIGCTVVASVHHAAAYRDPAAAYVGTRAGLGTVPARVSAGTYLVGQVAALAVLGRVVADFMFPEAASRTAAVVILLVVLAATTGLRIHGAAAWAWMAAMFVTLALVVAVCFAIQPELPESQPPPGGVTGITVATAVLCFAYLGFERVSLGNSSEERFTSATVRRTGWITIVVTTVTVGVFTAGLVQQLGYARLALSPNPVRDVLVAAAAPELTPLVSVLAAVALLPVLLATLESFRATAVAVVRDGDLPQRLVRASNAGTPFLLDLLCGIGAVVVVFLIEPVSAMMFAVCCVLVHYALTNASARHGLHAEGKWLARAACLGMGLCVLLFMSMPVPVLLATASVVIAGPVLAGLYTRRWS